MRDESTRGGIVHALVTRRQSPRQQIVETGKMRTTLPVHPIDLELFRTGGPVERRAVAQQLDAACRDTGFLVVTGHGVPRASSGRRLLSSSR